ncbi:MAG: hypothetical protein KAY05_09010, partial [Aeromonadaceae bacterium]|nr:hypothetical protein [Aeromonadaceae bacterium]
MRPSLRAGLPPDLSGEAPFPDGPGLPPDRSADAPGLLGLPGALEGFPAAAAGLLPAVAGLAAYPEVDAPVCR